MLTIVRCAVVIGVIYALSPVRDAAPGAPPAAKTSLQPGDAARLWEAVPENARRALLDTLAREALDRAAGAERTAR
ncbi:hypothetical protein [Salinarimonas soli]|uniref:Uncharacterized protein n=1 Tax=Salinarimonas soli TaxID=1638099 RepID=A0A5B2VC35_9HYPH|nr:hypothetical protein [Salinarimonas soli]KAA2236265.1 hypothetical protein F0L46_16285 [Salinarimonas soli]